MTKPLRALIVEDSEDDCELLVRRLRGEGYDPTFERVETPEAMATAFDHESWDIVLADYSMPHFSAPAALALMQQKNLDLPFIIVSGTIGEARAVEIMRSGAHDFISKTNYTRLGVVIQREIRDAANRAARSRADELVRARSHELAERVKEITCLYGVAKLAARPEHSLGELAQRVVEIIPAGWQYPEIACARLTILDGGEFRTQNFDSTRWKQVAEIEAEGQYFGSVEICYLEERPEIDEGPFMKEERTHRGYRCGIEPRL